MQSNGLRPSSTPLKYDAINEPDEQDQEPSQRQQLEFNKLYESPIFNDRCMAINDNDADESLIRNQSQKSQNQDDDALRFDQMHLQLKKRPTVDLNYSQLKKLTVKRQLIRNKT